MSVSEMQDYINRLSRDEQQALLRLLTDKLVAPSVKKKRPGRLLELAGLGAEIWEGVDPNEYVRHERESWD
jgi:hypothetical protein